MAMAGRRPALSSPLLLRRLSFFLPLSGGDTDNMQMEHRATVIIYGSYHAARDLMTVCTVCVGFALARAGRNRPTDKRRIPALCPILSGHLDKFIRARDGVRMLMLEPARTVALDRRCRDNCAGFLQTEDLWQWVALVCSIRHSYADVGKMAGDKFALLIVTCLKCFQFLELLSSLFFLQSLCLSEITNIVTRGTTIVY